MRLLDRRQRSTTALGYQLDEVKAVRTAQQRTDLAILELDDNLGKQCRQAVKRPHAQTAPLQRIRSIGIRRGQLSKVLTLFRALVDLFCLYLELLDLLGTRRLRCAQENMRHFVFLRGISRGRIAAQIIVDLAFGDDDLVVHFTLAHACNGHLLADILAKFREGDAIFLQGIAELGQRHLVVGGDALQRLLKLRIVDAHAAVARVLQLDLVHDQTIEHLPLKLAPRRQRRSLLLQLRDGKVETCIQLMQRDHFVIDDGNDPVDRLRFIRWLILSIGAEHTHQAEDCERFAKQGRHVRYPLFIED